MATYAATEIKDFAISGDGKEATFTLVTKYGGNFSFAMPVECLYILKHGPKVVKNEKGVTTSQGALHKPKKWVLGAETTKHKIVALIFDPQTDREAGFALSAKSAKDLADGLINSANKVANYKAPRPN